MFLQMYEHHCMVFAFDINLVIYKMNPHLFSLMTNNLFAVVLNQTIISNYMGAICLDKN